MHFFIIRNTYYPNMKRVPFTIGIIQSNHPKSLSYSDPGPPETGKSSVM